MAQPIPHSLSLGMQNQQRDIAVLSRDGQSPGLFWLGGYNSDMMGQKAQAIDIFGQENGLAVTRFDYMAHGQSTGDYMQACISTWLEDAIAVFENYAVGPQILIGSSMGGWLAMLLNRHLMKSGKGNLIKAMLPIGLVFLAVGALGQVFAKLAVILDPRSGASGSSVDEGATHG